MPVRRFDCLGHHRAGQACDCGCPDVPPTGQRLLDTAIAPLITQANWTPDSLNALDKELPRGSLPRTRVAIAAVLVAGARECGTSEYLAYMLQSLGGGLRDLGRPQEALAAIEEALGLWRNWSPPTPPTSPDSS